MPVLFYWGYFRIFIIPTAINPPARAVKSCGQCIITRRGEDTFRK